MALDYNKLSTNQNYTVSVTKLNITSVAGFEYSLWRSAVTGCALQGAIPGTTSVICTKTLAGGLILPSTNSYVHLKDINMTSTVIGMMFINDRLAHVGGLSGTVTTAQNVNISLSTQISDDRCKSDTTDVLWFLEWYTATGSTAVTATISYTNNSDIAKTTTVAIAASTPASRRLIIYPANDDESIKSIQSVTLSATTGTTGSFGVTAVKRIIDIPFILANSQVKMDYASTGLPIIRPNVSCIEFSFISTSTSTGILNGYINLIAP